MNCGHTMHTECFVEMHTQNQLLIVFFLCFLFYSVNLMSKTVVGCLYILYLSSRFRCPLCSKSLINMTRFWNILDVEVCNFAVLYVKCVFIGQYRILQGLYKG